MSIRSGGGRLPPESIHSPLTGATVANESRLLIYSRVTLGELSSGFENSLDAYQVLLHITFN